MKTVGGARKNTSYRHDHVERSNRLCYGSLVTGQELHIKPVSMINKSLLARFTVSLPYRPGALSKTDVQALSQSAEKLMKSSNVRSHAHWPIERCEKERITR